MQRWWRSSTAVLPLLGLSVLAASWNAGLVPGRGLEAVALVAVGVVLVGVVLSAVHHAEVVAHHVGEPYGSLILAVAVTVIEVGLIVTLMIDGGEGVQTLARDTVFAAVMITVNGIVGLSLLVSAARDRFAVFNSEGTGAALATVVALAGLTLVLPRFTTSRPGPEFSGSQLAFAGVASLVVWGIFVFTQTVRHRDFFLPVERRPPAPVDHASAAAATTDVDDDLASSAVDPDEDHAPPPTTRAAQVSLGLLLASLVAVVGLAKVSSPTIEVGVRSLGFPYATVGVAIALLVLLPESIAAVRAAMRRRLQIALNLGFGSAMASIGLTIPVIGVASIWLDGPLALGLEPVQIVLLVLTVLVGTLTIAPGRVGTLQGTLHLVLLGAFLFLTVHP